MTNQEVLKESNKRRTFAIISHPDAGKTTLTEKLLLYAGMIQTAGMVKGRKNRKGASSDWMKMEQDRGISITASVMQFLYKDVVINVLDTPGHQDFSEDTYRTLTAADSAVMVIDAAKGIEPQTKKLFKVCRMRGIPILTFINKMDLPGRETLDILSELEEVLGINTCPINWPIGSGKQFKGVVDRRTNQVLLFEKQGVGGEERAKMSTLSLDEMQDRIEPELLSELKDELELMEEAGNPYDQELFLAGELTPVFFGSALTNFGIEPFFDTFSDLAPAPREREATNTQGEQVTIAPAEHPFSAYVFKVQANLDPRHRDSMAYLRIVSGKFERDLSVKHTRLDKELRLSRSHSMFGGSRNTVDEAFPGDIVGVVNPGSFTIGDTISVEGGLNFKKMPKFPPEVVARIRPKDVMRRKSFEKGMQQFRNEGAVLVLSANRTDNTSDPLIAAVGILQFEVLQFRLQHEYKVESIIEPLAYKHGSWLLGDATTFSPPSSSMVAYDANGEAIFLYGQEWQKGYAQEKNPDHQLVDFIE